MTGELLNCDNSYSTVQSNVFKLNTTAPSLETAI